MFPPRPVYTPKYWGIHWHFSFSLVETRDLQYNRTLQAKNSSSFNTLQVRHEQNTRILRKLGNAQQSLISTPKPKLACSSFQVGDLGHLPSVVDLLVLAISLVACVRPSNRESGQELILCRYVMLIACARYLGSRLFVDSFGRRHVRHRAGRLIRHRRAALPWIGAAGLCPCASSTLTFGSCLLLRRHLALQGCSGGAIRAHRRGCCSCLLPLRAFHLYLLFYPRPSP